MNVLIIRNDPFQTRAADPIAVNARRIRGARPGNGYVPPMLAVHRDALDSKGDFI